MDGRLSPWGNTKGIEGLTTLGATSLGVKMAWSNRPKTKWAALFPNALSFHTLILPFQCKLYVCLYVARDS